VSFLNVWALLKPLWYGTAVRVRGRRRRRVGVLIPGRGARRRAEAAGSAPGSLTGTDTSELSLGVAR
jgi:hypothetical protein